MKKIYILLVMVISVYSTALAQTTVVGTGTATSDSSSVNTILQLPNAGIRAQNAFIELFGQGIWVTANYDTRFGSKRDGLGGRIGIGLGPAFDFDIWAGADVEKKAPVIVPVALNYLLGNGGKHFFEIGLGATFIMGEDGGAVGTSSFSYRLQPVDKGFSFRAGLTPIFDHEDFFPLFGGLSLGYTFQ